MFCFAARRAAAADLAARAFVSRRSICVWHGVAGGPRGFAHARASGRERWASCGRSRRAADLAAARPGESLGRSFGAEGASLGRLRRPLTLSRAFHCSVSHGSSSSTATEAAAPFLPPTPLTSLELVSELPLSTDLLGALLGSTCRRGDTILLSGGIGAGKSRLARSLIRAAVGDEGLAVPSPSYLLRLEYCAEWGGAYDESKSLEKRIEVHDPLRAIVKRDTENAEQEKAEREKGEEKDHATSSSSPSPPASSPSSSSSPSPSPPASYSSSSSSSPPASSPSSSSVRYEKPPWNKRCTMFDSEDEDWIVPPSALIDPPPPEPIPPPPTSSLVLSHIDLYRLTGPTAATSISRVDLAGAARQGVAIVEWPERLFEASVALGRDSGSGDKGANANEANRSGDAGIIGGSTTAGAGLAAAEADGELQGSAVRGSASQGFQAAQLLPSVANDGASSLAPSSSPGALDDAASLPASSPSEAVRPEPSVWAKPPAAPTLQRTPMPEEVLSPSPVSALLSVISPEALSPHKQREVDPNDFAAANGALYGDAGAGGERLDSTSSLASPAPSTEPPPPPLAPWLPLTCACYTPPLNGTLCILVEETEVWETESDVDLEHLADQCQSETANKDDPDPSTAQTDHASPPSPRVIRLCAPPTSSWRARLGRLREVIQSGGDGAGLYASYYEEEDDVMAGEGALGEDEVPGQDDDA